MFAGLKGYPDMKDSGVDWLGEIPAHWRMLRLKSSVINVLEYATETRREDGPVVALENVESWTGRVTQADLGSSFDSQLKRFQAGDVLFGKLRPYLAKVARSSFSGLCVGEFLVLRPRSQTYVGAYLEHLLRSKPLIDAVNSSTFGAKMPRASWQFMGAMPVARPPLSEQAEIVRVLRHADRRIRRYIRSKQELIALLEEQKKAVIHQAVTGQIDVRTGRPYPSYKASGVDWLRNIPVHWEMVRNGRLFVQRNEIGFPDLPILEVSLKTGVRVRDFENSGRKQAMSNRGDYKRAVKGDIAYNMMRMWQGAVGVTPVNGLVSPAYVVAKALPGNDPRYFGSLFRTSAYMVEVDKYSRGIVKDRNRLYWEDFKQMPSPCPPLDEQVLVADAIGRNAVVIGEAKQQVARQIDVVREYGTRLIADFVTGKLDVRSAVTELPGEDILGSAGESEEDSTVEQEMTV